MSNYLLNKPTLKKIRQTLRTKATHSEKVLWQDLRNKKFKGLKFYRQFSIGSFIYDFYCPEKQLAIELDGISHAAESVKARDEIKSDFLKEQGIQLLRFSDSELFENYEVVLRKIEGSIV